MIIGAPPALRCKNLGWGMLTKVTLPGGGALGVYQPRHGRPDAMTAE